MTRFDRVRDLVESELFPRVVALAAIAWTVIQFTAWQRAEARADAEDRRADAAEHAHAKDAVRWQVIADRCATNERGELACPAGVVAIPTATTVVAK